MASVEKIIGHFSTSHHQQIEENLHTSSPAYLPATLSVTNSVAVIEEIITFMDDFVKELTRAKFSQKKALDVTSRLVKRGFVEIFVPRVGVMRSFKIGNMRQTSGSILWSTIQSLDVAMKFKGVGFINLSIVSSELVKFLLINTGY